MAGAKWRLDNFTVIVDNNHLQNDAATEATMPVAPIADKWAAFGWNVVEIDGHDMAQIVVALEAARDRKGMPTVIIAETVKGKGVPYMENRPEWHGKAPNAEQAAIALAEIGGAL
jgi:transketolase